MPGFGTKASNLVPAFWRDSPWCGFSGCLDCDRPWAMVRRCQKSPATSELDHRYNLHWTKVSCKSCSVAVHVPREWWDMDYNGLYIYYIYICMWQTCWDAEVTRGTSILLCGSEGSGKSTLLRALAGEGGLWLQLLTMFTSASWAVEEQLDYIGLIFGW